MHPVYDPSQPTQGWLSVSNLPAARGYLTAASVNGKIYAIGGDGSSGYQSTVYVYDPSQPTQGWRSVSNLPAARGYLAAASVNGKLCAIGGSGSGGCQSTVYEGALAAGVSPASGPLAGGNTVTIGGSGLGNGDVTNVSLCGIAATMVADHSPTQIVVIAGAATVPTNGDVAVYSTSYGTTIKGNAYTYVETVTAPDPPAGSGIGETGSALTFITGASTNTEGYAVEYRFDWDDGSVSDWGSATGTHAFAAAGGYQVKAQARCAVHTNQVSAWSAPASVVVWSSGDVPGLSEDLVAHYSFNFGAMDVTGNGHDGTLTNGASISPDGRYGNALLLDGSNDYVCVPGSPEFALSNFSFSAWIKPARIPTGFDDYMCVVDDLTPSVAGGGAQLALGNSGFRGGYRDGIHSIAVDVQAGNPYAFSAGDTNDWHLLTFVTAWSNNQAVMHLYKDGQLAAVTTNALAPMAYDGQVLYIGVNCDGRSVGGPYQREYKGLIDDVKIYRRALAAAEVACLYANPAVNEEEVSPPDAPSGPADGYAGQVLAYSTTGSVSEAGHAVEYRFDWGDGDMSDWGPGQDTHAWAAPGAFPVKAQARCATDTNALSLWSAATALDIRTPTPGLVRLTASLINIAENAGSVTGWVERTGGYDLPASVDYATTANSAKIGADFIAVTGVLSWADGDAEAKPIVVPIVDDTVFEILERFTLSLSNAAGAAMGSPSSRSVYISDNDPEPVPIIRLSGDLAFGGVGTNATAVRTLTVHNDGTAALAVSAVTCPDGFTAEPQSFGVPAGGSSPVSVTFAPSAVTTYVGTITVSSDAMSGDGTVAVSGQGQVASLSFAAWLQRHAPGVDPATGFTEIDPHRGYAYGLLYAFGDHFPSNAVLMQVRLVNGGPVIDIPAQDELTLDGAEVLLQGTTNLPSGDWSGLLAPAPDTTGMPPNRRWWVAVGDPLQFFGRIQVQQK